MEHKIFPLIIIGIDKSTPLYFKDNEHKYAVIACQNMQDVERVITAWHKELNWQCRNFKINAEKKVIEFQYVDPIWCYKYEYNHEVEEWSWENCEYIFNTLYTFDELNN